MTQTYVRRLNETLYLRVQSALVLSFSQSSHADVVQTDLT